MQNLTLKLKQASALLGVPTKDLQNMVQLGVIRPARRKRAYWFDTNLLLEAKVAFYLKETLGSSSDFLARFTAAFSKNLGNTKIGDLGDICLRSRPLNRTTAVEIKIPVRSLARELEEQISRALADKDLPSGRETAGGGKDLLRSGQKARADGGNISDKKSLKTVRESRYRRKRRPEITVVARTKDKTA
jgi:hypothetical protein